VSRDGQIAGTMYITDLRDEDIEISVKVRGRYLCGLFSIWRWPKSSVGVGILIQTAYEYEYTVYI
jgi:hypothetical protein